MKNTMLYFSYSIVNGLMSFFTFPIFTKWLSPEDFGIFGYTEAINNFLIPFFILSLNSYYTKKYFDVKDKAENKKTLSSIFWFTLFWTTFASLLMVILGEYIFEIAGIKVPFMPYMLMTLSTNLILPFLTYLPLQYRIEKKALKYAVVMLSRLILIVIISIVLVDYFRMGLMGRYWGIIFGNSIFLFLCIFLIRKYIIFHLNLPLIFNALKLCVPLIFSALTVILYDVLDRVFLEKYVSISQMGYYNVANRFGAIILMGSTAFYKAFEPEIFYNSSIKNFRSISKLFLFTNLVLFVITFSLIVSSPFLIKVFTNNKFTESIPTMKILLAGYHIKYIYLMLITFMISIFRNKLIFLLSIIGLLVVCGLNFWLIPIYGIEGAAWAKLIMSIVLVIGAWIFSGAFRKFLFPLALILLLDIVLILVIL